MFMPVNDFSCDTRIWISSGYPEPVRTEACIKACSRAGYAVKIVADRISALIEYCGFTPDPVILDMNGAISEGCRGVA